jgi:putative SOS response-associated peptidase YedK
MCGRSSLHDAPVNILGRFHLPPSLPGFEPRFNIAPSQLQWTILLDSNGTPQARQLKWGLVPSWADDPAVGSRLVNARSDSLTGKPSYKDSFRDRRCVILADGYYEWTGKGRSRVPMFFHLAGNKPFAMAGIWDRWERDGERLDTCTIITTDASAKAGAYHHRMPAMLSADTAVEWLDRGASERRLLGLLAPYDESDLECHEVSTLVNSPLNDAAGCIAPFERDRVPEELTLWDI